MNEEIKQKIIKLILEDKKPLKEVAKTLYISEYQLRILLNGWNIELPKKRRYKIVEMPPRKELVELYSQKGNATEVAKHYEVGFNTVMRWMKKLDIPPRKLVNMTEEQKVDLLEKHIGKIDLENL